LRIITLTFATSSQLELRPDILLGNYRYIPYVSLKGSCASFDKFNLYISDDKGTQMGSVLDVKPNEEFKKITMLLNRNGFPRLVSNTDPQPMNGSLTLQIKLEATVYVNASSSLKGKYEKLVKDIAAVAQSDELTDFTFTVDGQDFPIHKAILGGKNEKNN